MTFEKGLLTLLVVEFLKLKTKIIVQVIFLQQQNKISSLSRPFTMGLSSTSLESSPQHCHNARAVGTSAKDVACFERTSATSGIKHFYFHILQASSSPKSFHCAAEDTTSKMTNKDFYGTLQGHYKFSKHLGSERK